jgi:hypothetical protein
MTTFLAIAEMSKLEFVRFDSKANCLISTSIKAKVTLEPALVQAQK